LLCHTRTQVNFVVYDKVKIEPTDSSFKHAIQFVTQVRTRSLLVIACAPLRMMFETFHPCHPDSPEGDSLRPL